MASPLNCSGCGCPIKTFALPVVFLDEGQVVNGVACPVCMKKLESGEYTLTMEGICKISLMAKKPGEDLQNRFKDFKDGRKDGR